MRFPPGSRAERELGVDQGNLCHLDDGFDLDGDSEREAADADCGAGMPLAKNLDEEVRV